MSLIATVVTKKILSKATKSLKGDVLGVSKKDLLNTATNIVTQELIPRAAKALNSSKNNTEAQSNNVEVELESNAEIQRLNDEINLIQQELKPQVLKLTELSRIMYGVNGKQTDETRDANKQYYLLLKVTQESRKKMQGLMNQRSEIKKAIDIEPSKTEYAIQLEEKRAIKEANVTSSTYERARKKLTKSVDGFLSGKFR